MAVVEESIDQYLGLNPNAVTAAWGKVHATRIVVLADDLGIDQQDHQQSSVTSVADCILELADRIEPQELPGFVELIDDCFNSDLEMGQEEFCRRFLHAFKQSPQGDVYQKVLADYSGEIQHICNDFVNGKIDAEKAGQQYALLASNKLPQHFSDLASAIPAAQDTLRGNTSWLASLSNNTFRRIRSLITKILPEKHDLKGLHSIQVCLSG
jgi:hypothetical protein